MFFPEFLFQLSQRDQNVTWLDPFALEASSAVAAADQSATIMADERDRVFILQAASIGGGPGAAQSVTQLQLRLLAPTPATMVAVIAREAFAVTANQNRTLNWSGSIIVPPGWRVQGRGIFDAGAAVNFVDLDVIGILIPVGNIQRV